MDRIERKDYVQTVTYKMMAILAAYRRLLGLSGGDYAEEIHRSRAMSDEHFDYVFDKSFIVLSEAGFVQVKDEEVKIVARHIAQALLYDVNEFTKVVEFEARVITITEKFHEDDISVLNAIAAITAHMNNFNKKQ